MDIALTSKTTPYFFSDISLTGPDLTVDHDLYTSIRIALFCDKRAEPSDSFEGDDPRGFWADSYTPFPGWKWGSRLWLLKRQKNTTQVANLAQQYALEALQFLIEDQIAASVQVTTERIDLYTLGIEVVVVKPNSIVPNKYYYVWSQF